MRLRTNLLVLFSILALIKIYPNLSDDPHKVKIKLSTHEDHTITKVYIAGNKNQLGNWKPDSVELRKENNYWEGEFTFDHGEQIEFKFTRGSWDTEALTDDGNIPENNRHVVENDTCLSYHVILWNNPDLKAINQGQITGTLVYHTSLKHKGLLERDIAVWLPPDYDQNLNERYPVIYMHDGQNIFDPAISFNNIDWQMDEAADSLIRKEVIEPLIIVGIYNTEDRNEEYSDTGKAIIYHKFIIESLKPLIDSAYRTKPEPENTAVGGSSMGGLAAFLLAWFYPEHFGKAACFSPAFKYEDFDFTNVVKNYKGPKKDISVFIYNGGIGVDDYLLNGVDLMKNALIKQGFSEGMDLFLKINNSAQHNESAWAKAVPLFLGLFFKDFNVSSSNPASK